MLEKREEKKSRKPFLPKFAFSTKPGNLSGKFPISACIHENKKRMYFFRCSAKQLKTHVCPEHYQTVLFMEEVCPAGGASIPPPELGATAPASDASSLTIGHPQEGPSLQSSSAGGVLLLPWLATHRPSKDGALLCPLRTLSP